MGKYANLKKKGNNNYWLYKKYYKMLLSDLSNYPETPMRVNKSGMYLTKYQILEYMLELSPELRAAYELKRKIQSI